MFCMVASGSCTDANTNVSPVSRGCSRRKYYHPVVVLTGQMSGDPNRLGDVNRRGAIRRLCEFLQGADAVVRVQDGETIGGRVPLRCCLEEVNVDNDQLKDIITELCEDRTTPIEQSINNGEYVIYFDTDAESAHAFTNNYRSDHPYKS